MKLCHTMCAVVQWCWGQGTWAVLRCFGGHAGMSTIGGSACLCESPSGAEPTCTKEARTPAEFQSCVRVKSDPDER